MPAQKPRPAAATTAPVESATVTARVARREQRRSRSREEILEAARRVLLRSGIGATTLDSVAKEIGVSKAALYYYFPSKDALLFELIFGTLESHAQAVHGATGKARNGGDALRAIVRETVNAFAPRIDDFRLAFLLGQVASPGSVHWDAQQFQRIRPLNDLCFADAAKKLTEEQKKRPGRARVEPRLMAFLAYLAALGMLTMKGMVESLDDPLAYSDEQLVEGFARVFEAAAAP
jgi:AcrR family transcriptional regulator